MFKSISKSLRSWFKPGISTYNYAIPAPASSDPPSFPNNSNAEAVCDNFGNQWIRDAGLPSAFRGQSNPLNTNFEWFMGPSVWVRQVNSTLFYLDPQNASCIALFRIVVNGGDPAVTWPTAPLYVQLLQGFTSVNPPVSGASVPTISLPVPRPPLYLDFSLGVRTPIATFDVGAAIALSSTRDVFTAVATTGFFDVNYAQSQAREARN